MIQPTTNIRTALRTYPTMARHELMNQRLYKVVSETTLSKGLKHGLSVEEIVEIIDECYMELVGMKR